jgi:uncharacterized protein involved in exopolysaccharide biosynthesis
MSSDKPTQPLSVSELLDFGRYCMRAVLRHPRLGLSLFFVAVGIAFMAALAMPNTYSVTARILTKRSYIIPSLVSPQRAIPIDSDRPTHGAAETILSFSFREELFEAVNLRLLLERYQSRYERFYSKLQTIVGGEVDPRKIRAGLIELLGRSIEVDVIHGRVISIEVTWSHPAVAHTLAQAIVDQYLRHQKGAEIDEIHDTVDIIQRTLIRTHARLTETSATLTELIRRKEGELTQRLTVRESRERRTVSFRRPAATALESTARDGDQDQAQRIREMERQLRRLVDQHGQRLDRARQNLKRLEESLGPRHPDLQAARREVEEARPVPAEITKLRAQVATARARLPTPQSSAAPSGARFEVVQMPLSEDVYNALQADPEVGHMMEEVNKYAVEYGALLDRLEAAELEIEMANAAFAYRYTVTQPPTFPTQPISSKRKLVLVAGVFFGTLFAFAACLLSELASGRLRARWQVERLLGVPVLGEVRLDD